MNGDALAIMTELGRIHADLKEDIGNVRADLAGFKGTITSDLNATTNRVIELEEDIKSRAYWQNVRTYVTVPIVFVLHKTATILGIKI